METIIIAEWPLNRRESFRVTLSEYKDQPVIDARVWYADGAGHVKPGKRGCTLGVRQLPKLADAMSKALNEARARGLVEPSNNGLEADSGERKGAAPAAPDEMAKPERMSAQ